MYKYRVYFRDGTTYDLTTKNGNLQFSSADIILSNKELIIPREVLKFIILLQSGKDEVVTVERRVGKK